MSLKGWSIALAGASALLAAGCTDSKDSKGSTEQPRSAAVEQSQQRPAAGGGETAGGGKIPRVFVANYRSDTISVIEGDPGMEQHVIPGGASPHGMDVRPTEPRLLAVAQSTGFGVLFIDPNTLEKKGEVETNRGPQDLVFSQDGKRLFVISPMEWTLHVIDVDKLEVAGEPVKFKKKPRRILLSPDGTKLFVLLVTGGDGIDASIGVLSVDSLEIEREVRVGRHPQAIAIGNGGKTLASASFDDSTVSVIDLETLDLKVTQPAETGMGLAIHKDKPIAYSMASFDDEIHIVDLNSGETIKSFSAGRWPTYPAYGPDGRYLYIPHEESDSVIKLDTETNEVIAKIAVGEEPIEVVVYEP